MMIPVSHFSFYNFKSLTAIEYKQVLLKKMTAFNKLIGVLANESTKKLKIPS